MSANTNNNQEPPLLPDSSASDDNVDIAAVARDDDEALMASAATHNTTATAATTNGGLGTDESGEFYDAQSHIHDDEEEDDDDDEADDDHHDEDEEDEDDDGRAEILRRVPRDDFADDDEEEVEADEEDGPDDDAADHSASDGETDQVARLCDHFKLWRDALVDPFGMVLKTEIEAKIEMQRFTDKKAEAEGKQADDGDETSGSPHSTDNAAIATTLVGKDRSATTPNLDPLAYKSPPTEAELNKPAIDYKWRSILGKNYSDRMDLLPKPKGTRDPSKRFAWETAELDVVLLLPMGEYDVEFCLQRMAEVIEQEIPERPTTAYVRPMLTGDYHFVLLLACAICRRWMAEFAPKHVDCGVEIVTSRYSEFLRHAEAFARIEQQTNGRETSETNPMFRYIFNAYLEMRQLSAKHISRILCDMTKAPTGPVDLATEAFRIGDIQQRLVGDNRDPKLDLDERMSAELSNYIRSCSPMWKNDSADGKYLKYLVDHLPKVMSVPHPLSAFAVRPLNPIVALGNHFTCDLCYTPHIRASYQAVQDDDEAATHADEPTNNGGEGDQNGGNNNSNTPPSTGNAAGRNVVELIKNCFGFDLCLRCTCQYYHEALAAVAEAIQWHDAPLYLEGRAMKKALSPTKAAAAAGGKPSPSSSAAAPTVKQVTLCKDIGCLGQTAATPIVATPASPIQPHSSTIPCRVSIVASGTRPIIDINNQLQVMDTAVVRVKHSNVLSAAASSNALNGTYGAVPSNNSTVNGRAQQQQPAGMLIMKCAVAPLGARPLARKWKSEYVEAIAADVEEAYGASAAGTAAPSSANPTTAAKKLILVSKHLKTYFENASQCYAKRWLSREERLLVGESGSKKRVREEDGGGASDEDDDDDEEENVCPICYEALAPRTDAQRTALIGAGDDIDADFKNLSSKTSPNTTGWANSGGDSANASLSAPPPPAIAATTTITPAVAAGGSSSMVRAVVQTTCRHWFHARCIDRYFAESRNTLCPMCRTPNALDTLTAQRFVKKPTTAEGDEGIRGDGEDGVEGGAIPPTPTNPNDENAVTPAMIAAEARKNLEQNVYELRIPLTAEEVQMVQCSGSGFVSRGTSAASSGSSGKKLRVLVGTLVSLDCQYHNATDIGCLVQLEVSAL